jgi:hypothetical protein
LEEHWSTKPEAGGSSPSRRTIFKENIMAIEQGARDSLQMAINNLMSARDAKDDDEFNFSIEEALRELANACQIQKIGRIGSSECELVIFK